MKSVRRAKPSDIIARFPNALPVGVLNENSAKFVLQIIDEYHFWRLIGDEFLVANEPGSPIETLQEACIKFGQVESMCDFAERIVGADVIALAKGILNSEVEQRGSYFPDYFRYIEILSENFPQILTEEVIVEMTAGVAL